MKVLAVSQNKAFFEMMKEYKFEKESILIKYKSNAAKWYKKKFHSLVYGYNYSDSKPINYKSRAKDEGL